MGFFLFKKEFTINFLVGGNNNMKPKQEGIYYISGESLEVLKSSPFTEKLKHSIFLKKNIIKKQ